MSVSLPNGSLIHLGTLGASFAVTAATNAAESVITVGAGHGIVVNDYFVFVSGWSRASDKVYRAKTVVTNDITVEGLNTIDTAVFSAAGGVGTVRKVTAFTQITQVLSSQGNGGEQQFATYQFLEADREVRIPTKKAAGGLTLSVADDPTLAGYLAMSAANDDRVPRPIRATLPNGSKILYYGFVSLNKTPTLTIDELMACEATVSFINEPVRYQT